MSRGVSPRSVGASGVERLGVDGAAEIMAVAATEGTNAAAVLALRRDPGLVRHLATTGRADWRFHLPSHAQGRAVVLDSGLGGMAFDLSEHYEQVVSCESSASARKWQELRCSEECLTNLQVMGMDRGAVQLPDAVADVVAIDRGAGATHGETAGVLLMLSEARRLLKVGGWLYWGFANRCSKLRPGRSTVRRSNDRLRVTPWEARRMITRVGFEECALYWLRPSWEEQVTSARLDDPRMIREFLRTRQVRGVATLLRSLAEGAVVRVGLLGVIVPCLFVLARRCDDATGNRS